MHWMAVGRRLTGCSVENQGKDEGIVSKSRCPLSLLRRSSGDRNIDFRVRGLPMSDAGRVRRVE
jgi:hypothetical protein